jgi:hypothetical protein
MDNERLNDLAIMCAEMTACCNSLASEWLGVLLALCCPIAHPGYYTDVLAQLDIQDVSIHNALAVFTCILIARHCFSLEDFVGRVALPSLLKVNLSTRNTAFVSKTFVMTDENVVLPVERSAIVKTSLRYAFQLNLLGFRTNAV